MNSERGYQRQTERHLASAKERVVSARVLLEIGHYRDSISRSYYAILDAATALLLSRGLIVKTHAGAILLFSRHFIKTKDIATRYVRLFQRAKVAREEADYEAMRTVVKQDAEEAVRNAEEFIRGMERKLSAPQDRL